MSPRTMAILATLVFNLWSKPVDRPGTVGQPRVTKAIVQAIRTALPEFDSLGVKSISAPMRRQRNFSLGKALLHLFESGSKHAPRVDHFALTRCQSAKRRARRAGMKILL